MGTETTTKESKETAFKFDEAKVKAKFATIEKAVNDQQGKRGYNPFVFINETVNPLVKRFIGSKEEKIEPERTKELQDTILSLPDEPPKFFEASQEPIKEPKTKIITP